MRIYVSKLGFRIRSGKFWFPSPTERISWEDREFAYSYIRGYYAKDGKRAFGRAVIRRLEKFRKDLT